MNSKTVNAKSNESKKHVGFKMNTGLFSLIAISTFVIKHFELGGYGSNDTFTSVIDVAFWISFIVAILPIVFILLTTIILSVLWGLSKLFERNSD